MKHAITVKFGYLGAPYMNNSSLKLNKTGNVRRKETASCDRSCSVNGLWCNTAGRGMIGHQLDTAWVKVLRLCFTDD